MTLKRKNKVYGRIVGSLGEGKDSPMIGRFGVRLHPPAGVDASGQR
jgi:hypothetical protein